MRPASSFALKEKWFDAVELTSYIDSEAPPFQETVGVRKGRGKEDGGGDFHSTILQVHSFSSHQNLSQVNRCPANVPLVKMSFASQSVGLCITLTGPDKQFTG